MKKILPLYSLLLFFVACGQQKATTEKSENIEQAKIVQFDAIEDLMNDESGQLQVINFWATWCGPCVKELPHFEAAREKYAEKGVQFTLVSLDFANKFDSTVVPFIEKKGLKSRVWLLDNTDYNSWIDKVDPSWEGEIPVTLIVNKQQNIREFVPKEVTAEELDKLIEKAL